MFSLLDANNFYVSCERRFNPQLERRAVIVLSNNDGCAISRSDEAKALGIKMGEPFFQIKERFASSAFTAFSANFALYADMSARLMGEAATFGADQEIYSVDECFIDLTGIRGDLHRRGLAMRQRLLRRLGLPCGVGIGATKTLAKLANHIAKTAARKPGSYPPEMAHVCHLDLGRGGLPASDFDALLRATPVTDIWGIGRRLGAQLQAVGVNDAYDFVQTDAGLVRQRWGVVLERTLRELQGQSCLQLETMPRKKQEIAFTRSFGRFVEDLATLQEAVQEFTARAAEKLRKQNSLAGQIHIFCMTSSHRAGAQHHGAVTVPLIQPSCETRVLSHAALQGLAAIYRPGNRYAKAGVFLLDLQPSMTGALAELQEPSQLLLWSDENALRAPLWPPPEGSATPGQLMQVVDELNQRFGRGTLQWGSARGINRAIPRWQMNQHYRSPHYTTDWAEIIKAYA